MTHLKHILIAAFVSILSLVGLLVLDLKLAYTPAQADPAQNSEEPQRSLQPRDMSREELAEFIADFIMKNPKVMIESLQTFQAEQQGNSLMASMPSPEKMAELHDRIYNNDAIPAAGAENGDITIVEFFDYNCGYCKHMLPTMLQLIEKNPNVTVMFREYPILSEPSFEAAKFAMAAHLQGKYFEIHSALMSYNGTRNTDSLMRLARRHDLDVEKLKQDMESEEVLSTLHENFQLADELGIRGTPALIVGDTILPGALDYEDLMSVIEQHRTQEAKTP